MMAEDGIRVSDKEIEGVGEVYNDYYKWRSYRSGLIKHFQNYDFQSYLTLSRELFWNSLVTESEDLAALNLDFSIPFARKEVMDFIGRLNSLSIKPELVGDNMDALGTKMLQAIYKKWCFTSNDKVENFWELLYGIVNGTVCSYIGYNNDEVQRRYLKSYDPKTGAFELKKETHKKNEVFKEIVPIEDIYLPKIYERNIQKQGKMLWKKQMEESDFRAEFGKYPMAKYVFPGSRVAEDSLYFKLLGGSGTITANKIEVMKKYDWQSDTYQIVASGIVLNKLGHGEEIEWAPMPFNHKMAPFTWGIIGPLDEKICYGLSTPFQIKDPHKILNTSYTMMVERELRAIDPPILTSDLESPELIFGQHKVVPVNDVNAYKEMKISEPSNQFFAMQNSLQGLMSAQANGGDASVAPSRQPKAAREIMAIEKMKQQSMANAVTMYYDILRQRILLVLKTSLQFMTLDKYNATDKRVYKDLLIPDMPLTEGGVGNMRLRIVKDKQPDMAMFLEAIRESAQNGKQTEIVEVPISFIENLEFSINRIDLEPEDSNDLEIANFVENVLNPMINTYIPAGVADMSKTFQRHMEKLGENPSDFAKDPNAPTPAGAPGQATPGQAGVGQTQGNLQQINTGIKFGANNSSPLPITK
jgi:hypothetical protein